jgi:hypothetical protein
LSDTTVKGYLSELEKQLPFKSESGKGSIRWYINWYRTRAPRHRIMFRTVGVAMLLISVTLPIILNHPDSDYGNWVPTRPMWLARVLTFFFSHVLAPTLLSYVLAFLAALNAFYQWQQAWQAT